MGIRYKTTTLNGAPILSHRKAWILANGPIPAGHHVHHINGNKFDNRLENLECLPGSEHVAEHNRGRPAWNKGMAYGQTEAFKRGQHNRRINHVERCIETYKLWKQGFTQQKVASIIGIGREQVSNRLRFLRANGYVSD